jgi:hypothetical protein
MGCLKTMDSGLRGNDMSEEITAFVGMTMRCGNEMAGAGMTEIKPL